MPTQEGSTRIDASREAVWDVVSDVSRLGEWATIHRGIEGEAPDRLEQDSAFTQQIEVAGQEFEVEWTVREISEPERMVWDGDGPLGSSARSVYELSDDGDGVEFTYRTDFDVPGGKVGSKAAEVVTSKSDDEARESLDRLKRLLES